MEREGKKWKEYMHRDTKNDREKDREIVTQTQRDEDCQRPRQTNK